ncbi:MAG: hypothetical protein A3K19_20625 [Lentisphaerae bacterium RIFOXYB12_FULL_65_16]|nr:MAG: hypothetical protein A3K18_22215 [Lentisphaerae bacterium RIFOXYA12_64_32]OGV89403.1 MAG: hypothetical protein A3K19_20625 [Lentisphaerae bacterium RIFOXYB12_FULL_65_16]
MNAVADGAATGLRISRAQLVHRYVVRRIFKGELRPEQRLEPIRDIARITGVSHATVAGAFKSLAREGWIVARPGRGSFVAAAPPLHMRDLYAESAPWGAGGASAGGAVPGTGGTVLVLGAVQPDQRQSSHMFQILAGIQSASEERGWRTKLFMVRDADIAAVLRATPDYIGATGSDGVAPVLSAQGVSLDRFVYYGLFVGDGLTGVAPDNLGGAMLATRHLLDRGHRRIQFVTGQVPRVAGETGELPTLGRYFALRAHGWRQTMLDAGLTPSEAVPWNIRNPESVAHVRSLLDGARRRAPDAPTALLVSKDVMAMEILEHAAEMNVRVPEDISVLGIEDWDISTDTHPPLSSVGYPKRLMGEECMSRLAQLQQRPDIRGSQVLLPMSIVERASVATHPAA